MTTFGCDSSSWNGALKFRDGLDFYTNKVTDGDHFYADPTYQSHMVQALKLGIPVLGSYHVQHGQRSIANQADWWFQMVQSQTSWWRQQAAFIWQCDAEPFGYNIAPTIDEINALGDAICQRAGVPASSYVAYAPSWFYGAKLTGLRYRQWQSNYAGNPATGYQAAYPGDSSPRWSTYVNPLILQYGSRTTIGDLGGMDANAYRGTVDQLIADLNGGKTVTPDQETTLLKQVAAIDYILWQGAWKPDGSARTDIRQYFADIQATLAGNEAKDAARDAALTTLIQSLVNTDATGLSEAQLAALVAAVRDAATQAGTDAQAAILARLDAQKAREAAAAQAEADALKS